MRKPVLALAAAALAAAALALVPLTGDAASPTLQFVVAEGPALKLPPATVSDEKSYVVRCPKGYIATGHGLNTGAARLVFADPEPAINGYSFAFLNQDGQDSATVSATVICARGKGLRVRASALPTAGRARAIREARAWLRDGPAAP